MPKRRRPRPHRRGFCLAAGRRGERRMYVRGSFAQCRRGDDGGRAPCGGRRARGAGSGAGRNWRRCARRWSASAPGNRRAWRRTRRRGVARRWSGALRPPREIGNFCTSTCARACLPTLPPRLRDAANAGKSDAEVFSASRGRKTASPPRTRRRPCPRPRQRNGTRQRRRGLPRPAALRTVPSLPSASRSAPAAIWRNERAALCGHPRALSGSPRARPFLSARCRVPFLTAPPARPSPPSGEAGVRAGRPGRNGRRAPIKPANAKTALTENQTRFLFS